MADAAIEAVWIIPFIFYYYTMPMVARQLLWLPTYCLRANPIEQVVGDVHDKCTRDHKRKRLRDLVQDVEQHIAENGPWQYRLSHLYETSEVTAAVEQIAAERHAKIAA